MEKLHVLVVEDHGFQLDYVTNCLKQIGVRQVSSAMDGALGLIEYEKAINSAMPVNLIICDLQMPNMDGIEFIRTLADRKYAGGLIILTAMDTALVASVCKMVGEYKLRFIGALEKPVNTSELVTYVSEACDDSKIKFHRPLPKGVDESELVNALDRGDLIAHYQPKYHFQSGKLVGLEALVRLRLPDDTLIYPDDFIYLYKQLDRTSEFELNTYQQAFRFVGSLLKRGQVIKISINICANMLGDKAFYQSMLVLAAQYSVPHDLITVEVTERSLIRNVADSIEFLARLRINGFNLAVDDFGTGYSSIKQLDTMPFNEIKIDKSFVLGIEKDKQKQAIVRTIVELAQRLDLTTVAEGVEDKRCWDLVRDLGCDICQGYYTGKPMSQQEAEKLVLSGNPSV